MRWLHLRVTILVVIGAIFASVTMSRVRLWSGPELYLWVEATQQSPAQPRAWTLLGNQYWNVEADTPALAAYHRSLALSLNNDRSPEERSLGRGITEANIAGVYESEREFSRALSMASFAHDLAPLHPQVTAIYDRLNRRSTK